MSQPFEFLSIVSNDAFREIFQSMTEGIIVVDQRGSILIANPVAEEMFGYDSNELSGKTLESLLPERHRGRHLQFREEFRGNPIPRRMGRGRDLSALRKDGAEFPVEISLNFSEAGGNFIAMAFITDISFRKKAEEALRQSEEQLILYASELEKKVEARTSDLNNSIRSLEHEIFERKKAEEEARRSLEKERELNDLKSKFVSIASHEFRTPLSTILSSISLVEQYLSRKDYDKIDKHTDRIRSSVHHLTAILNDFLSLGKLEEGRVEINLEKVELRAFLNEVVETINPLLKPGQKILSEDISNISVSTDRNVLRNIVFNLLSNASKYSDENKRIWLTTEADEKTFSVIIRDEGIGIPAEEHKHLFERFFRASNSGNVQGTGLGLSIVKRYVELLGGSLQFQSNTQGSSFTFILPILR